MRISCGFVMGLLAIWGGLEAAAGDEPAKHDQSLAERFAVIKAEYAAQREIMGKAVDAAKTERESMDLYEKLRPDDVIYSRRMVDLALEQPTTVVARDALIWVLTEQNQIDVGAYGDEFARAAALLIRHHGDDPIAASVGLLMCQMAAMTHHDTIVFGFLASAKSREAKGIARLALGRYLETKAGMIESARSHPARQTLTYHGVIGDDGKPYDQQVEQDDERYAYHLACALGDPVATQSEAERLYHEVILDYGDIPHVTPHRRKLEAMMSESDPRPNGQPLSEQERRDLAEYLAQKPTLGSMAEGYLDEMHNIAPGKPAPAIDGTDLNGQPLKLVDYRGKVVVLVFWGSWCGPCIREMSYERELNAKYQGRPFALLGVDCNDTKEAAQKVIAAEQVTWPNFDDGHGLDGPIVKSYHVRGYPSSFVIDAQGIIRHKDLTGQALDDAVAKLIAEVEIPAAK